MSHECDWCGFDGIGPEDWWHLRLGGAGELCDLCHNTGRGYSETLEIVNHAANRILEAIRRVPESEER